MQSIFRLLILGVAIASICSPLSAQNKRQQKKAPAKPVVVEPRYNVIDSLIQAYLFEDALDIIEEDIEALQESDRSPQRLEALKATAQLGQNMLEATEDIVIVDSIVCNKGDILSLITLDKSCGTLLSPNQVKEKADLKLLPSGTGFINNFSDHIIFARPSKGGAAVLTEMVLYGNQWSAPQSLEGLADSLSQQGYPFVLSDGVTLYFAQKGKGSLGGYDIFLTRLNSNTKSFLKPENVGMPFNSLANDYLMAIDEVNNLGWFVSDRYQSEGKVCIYVFVPKETREVFESDDESLLRRQASLQSISITQNKSHKQEVADAQLRLKNLSCFKENAEDNMQFSFDLGYGARLTSLDQFKNAQARSLATDWIIASTKFKQLKQMLLDNRHKYGQAASEAERTALSPIILRQEKEVEAMQKQLFELANTIRLKEGVSK